MSITFAIDPDAALIRTTLSGNVTLPEVQQHLDDLFATWPESSSRLRVLLDVTGCTSLPELNQLRVVANQIAGLGGGAHFDRCAIVASRELLYGLLRVFEVMADGTFVVRVFRDESEATKWLG